MEKVGNVTEKEKILLLKSFEKKQSLNELFLTLGNSQYTNEEIDMVFEKIVLNIGKSIFEILEWWRKTPQNYTWKAVENGEWTINFETNEIFLMNT